MGIQTKEFFTALPLRAQLEQLTRVGSKTRQELILSARNKVALARALPPEMLLFTLKEVGLADSVELLALAAPEQVRDMMDLDCWHKGRLDVRRIVSWLMLLDEAGGGKLAEWFLHADMELLVLLVKEHFEVVRKAEVEESTNFDQSRYFTFDDQYLLRFRGEEEPILQLLLERLRVLDYGAYREVLENSLFELGGELEENALRWRNARLADRGYPDYEEARELYRFTPPDLISLHQYRRVTSAPLRFAYDEEMIPPSHVLSLLTAADSFFVRALTTLTSEELEEVGQELAYLTNQVVVAEACDLGELAEVRRCAELTHDYLTIGLAYAADGDDTAATHLLRETTLRPFFQIGVNLTVRLHLQVKKIEQDLRERGIPYWTDYLDSPIQETCVGVQRRPPRFFLGLVTPGEVLYRRFLTLTEVQQVEVVLARVPWWFAVMQRWGLLPEGKAPQGVTLALLWNTAFAWWLIEGRADVRPLKRKELGVLQARLRGQDIAKEISEFVALRALHFQWSAEEEEAMRALAFLAREKLLEALAIDVATADLKFVEGLLVVE